MSKHPLLWAVLIGLLAFSACEKPDLHENLVVEGNVAPPHEGISSLQLDHFVNKMYIDLLGRGPTDEELSAAVQEIKEEDYSEAIR